MKGLLRFFFLIAFAVFLSTIASIAVRRWWALLPFAEYEAKCGLTSGSIVQGKTYYDFAEDRPNPTRLQELQEMASALWEGGVFCQMVVTSCLTNTVARSIDPDEIERIISTVSVEVVPRRSPVLVCMRGRNAAAVARLVEAYAYEIERTAQSSNQERLDRMVEQLSRNLDCQIAVVTRIEKRKQDAEKSSKAVSSNEIAKLSAELRIARDICECMEEQLANTKASISHGEIGTFIRMTQKVAEVKLEVPGFWLVLQCVFPVVLVIVLILCWQKERTTCSRHIGELKLKDRSGGPCQIT